MTAPTRLSALGVPPEGVWEGLAFFRLRAVAGGFLLTEPGGRFAWLRPEELARALRGELDGGDPLRRRLAEAGLLREGFDVAAAADALAARKVALAHGPSLHRIEIARREADGSVRAMAALLASRVLDFASSTSSPHLTVELDGAPLSAWDRTQEVVARARAVAAEAGKALSLVVVDRLEDADEGRLATLSERGVRLRAVWARALTEQAEDRLAAARRCMGEDLEVELTVDTPLPAAPRDVVAALARAGVGRVRLRPAEPTDDPRRPAPSAAAYLAFYREALDAMLASGGGGEGPVEATAAAFLAAILGGVAPPDPDLGWPASPGTGQLAYDVDGGVATCADGRAAARAGDPAFLLGDVRATTLGAALAHPVVRAIALASNPEQQPDCEGCAYQPYCAVSPVHTHRAQGSIFGDMRRSRRCRIQKGVQDLLFERLVSEDERLRATLLRWARATAGMAFASPTA